MGVDYQARQIYDMQIKDVTTSPEKWKSILKLAGNLYRYEFDNILLIYAQRPHATLVADYDTWKKVDRYVMRGSKGIAIFPSRALNTHLRHVFDIKDTGGRNVKLTWDLTGDTLREYVDYLASQKLVEPTEVTDRETLFSVMKDFTKKEIGVIMKEDFEERMSRVQIGARSHLRARQVARLVEVEHIMPIGVVPICGAVGTDALAVDRLRIITALAEVEQPHEHVHGSDELRVHAVH